MSSSTTAAAPEPPNVTPMEALLGPKLLTKKEGGTTTTPTEDDTFTLLKGKKLVALYFSASWCPPCKTFTPVLIDFYGKHCKNDVEIVYVSSDKTASEFDAYYGKMPWLAVPPAATEIRSKLASALQIQGIPTLVVLDAATGQFVSNDARAEVQRAAGSAAKAKEVIATWKATPPVPFEEGLQQPNDPVSLLKRFVTMLLRNPLYMFALLYFGKKALRALGYIGAGGAGAGEAAKPEEAAAAYDNEPIPDDEF